jgi:hypothetical protein
MDDGFIIIVPADGEPYLGNAIFDLEVNRAEGDYTLCAVAINIGGVLRTGVIMRSRDTSAWDEVKIRELVAMKYLGPPRDDY